MKLAIGTFGLLVAGAVVGCGTGPAKVAKPDSKSVVAQEPSMPVVVVEEPKRVVALVPEPMREVFPGVRLDKAGGGVEFEGEIAVDAHVAETPNIFLEVIVCRADSREHESVVVTKVLPSHVHAALLLLGAQPGAPTSWKKAENGEIVSVPPTGGKVAVTITHMTPAGQLFTLAANDFVKLQRDGTKLGAAKAGAGGFVFAGSRFTKVRGQERYAADLSGTIVGLCSFGDEPIAWSQVFSPEAATEEPQWLIDAAVTPAKGTKVTVRMELVK